MNGWRMNGHMDGWTVESRPERYRWMDGRTVGWTETKMIDIGLYNAVSLPKVKFYVVCLWSRRGFRENSIWSNILNESFCIQTCGSGESQCLIGFSIYTSNPPILPATSRRRNSVILCYLLPFPSTGISLSKKSIRGYIKKKEQVRLYIPPLLFAIKKQTNSIHMPEFVRGKAPEYVKKKFMPRLFTGNWSVCGYLHWL